VLSPTIAAGAPSSIRQATSRPFAQVLVNLLTNAVKFTEQGEVVLTVDPQGGDRLHFAVRDTGIGIPAEGMGRLFRSFSQVDASTTRRYDGTGQGLAISRRLCELMGGTMWAESEHAKGSAFHFTSVRRLPSVRPSPRRCAASAC
jgi:signal transduction histidine kinase